ncbi:DNA double-strand break repair nuclease NurA [Methanolacinia paynteri]|uniref:DNA double-strand break repair nuclease NurA n=1 Tax=Methanolacinia paynteri TaxID=230356 RepID=UPI00064E918E|nr:DNA double-strand break repair nuclease NurA [Methanolacinia paynteri]
MIESESGIDLGKILIHPEFFNCLNELKEKKIYLNNIPIPDSVNFNSELFPSDEGILSFIEKNLKYKLDPLAGIDLTDRGYLIAAYDESIDKFEAIEGSAYLTAHSIVFLSENDYLPLISLSLNFYTRSSIITKNSKYIQYSKDIENCRKENYIKERDVLFKNCFSQFPKNTIVFIDGPIIGGQISSYTTKLNSWMIENNLIPIFIVKNSSSNLVTDRIQEFKNKYNSDLHWSYALLKEGERTGFIQYQDLYNKDNGKIFCYIKTFNQSPQRVEFHIKTLEKYGIELLSQIIELVYYLILVQGEWKNPQIRPIAIAEKFARESIKLFNLKLSMKNLGLISTMNQERFG